MRERCDGCANAMPPPSPPTATAVTASVVTASVASLPGLFVCGLLSQ